MSGSDKKVRKEIRREYSKQVNAKADEFVLGQMQKALDQRDKTNAENRRLKDSRRRWQAAFWLALSVAVGEIAVVIIMKVVGLWAL